MRQLKEIIVEDLRIGSTVNNIDETSSLFSDGIGLNSLAIVDFISLIESRFGFEFPELDLDLETFASLENVTNVVLKSIELSNGESRLANQSHWVILHGK